MKHYLLITVFSFFSIPVLAQEQTPAVVAPTDPPKPNTPKILPVNATPKGAATTSEGPSTHPASVTPVFFISCFNPIDVHHDAIDLRKVPAKVREYAAKTFIKTAEVARINQEFVGAPDKTSTKQKIISEFSDLEFSTYQDIWSDCRHEKLVNGGAYKFDFALSADIKLDPQFSSKFWTVTFTINSKKSAFMGLEELPIPCVQDVRFNTDSVARRVVNYMRTNKQVFLSYINDENKKRPK